MKKYSIILAISICSLFIIINGGWYYWQQISLFSGPLFMIFSFILWILILVLLIYSSKNSVKNLKTLNSKKLISSYLYLFTLILGFISPRWIHASNYLSKIKYRGCYEGTMNTATIYFRESGEFEYKHVGFFGATTFEKGNWTIDGDTISINYENKTPSFIGNKLLITKNNFIRIHNDTLNCEVRKIYRGYCRRKN